MSGLTGWFDVFRCGTHTDRFGRQVTITKDDIDRAIGAYVSDSAPIVVGHPTLNAPAYGWITSFRRIGDIVQAKASTVADEFADLVKRRLYKNRSLAFGPGLKFRHVGFLGAQPPAVKGLKDVQFDSEEEFMDVEFSESTPAAAEVAAAQPADENSNASASASQPGTEAAQLPEAEKAEDKEAEKAEPESVLAELDAVRKELHAIKKDFQEAGSRIKQLEGDNAKLKADYDAAARELRKNEFSAFADNLIAGGRLAKEQRGQLLEFMEYLHGLPAYEFSEGSKPLLQSFEDLFKAVSKRPVQFGEFASSEKAATVQEMTPAEMAAKAREYMDAEAQKGRTVSATQAIAHIQKG